MFSNRNQKKKAPEEPVGIVFGAKYSNRCEDILSCISALDDVIAEFDDPSLPYINEEDTALGQSSHFYVGGGDKLVSELPSHPVVKPPSVTSSKVTHKTSSIQSSSSSSSGGVAGGTYSKGSNYEILLPRIPSNNNNNEKKSSSRTLEEPIYSSIGKSRPQISLGLYSDGEEKEKQQVSYGVRGQQIYPDEPEVDYNKEERGGDEFYDNSTRPSNSSGKKTEEWNFPSEKNLPRSLRKTRKTCFLEDKSGQNNISGVESHLHNNDSNGEGAGGHSSPSGGSVKMQSKCFEEEINQKNGKRRDERERKIVPSSSQNNSHGQNNKNNNNIIIIPTQEEEEEEESPSTSRSSSISFTISSAVDQPIPKPRVRQQIPTTNTTTTQDDNQSPSSHVKYGAVKIPKPNPKPGRSSSPTSPVQYEMSRDEDQLHNNNSGIITGGKRPRSGKTRTCTNGSGGSLSSVDESQSSEAVVVVAVGASGGKGGPNMMRMMMMNKPSANKHSSTGSGSSISRSSSSSSGGDPNYFNKGHDHNLSSSSGVVVTTNSSTTSTSPTHSVHTNHHHNNNNNSSITLISSSQGIKVKGQQQQQQQQQAVEVKCRQQIQPGQNNHKVTILPANGNGTLDVDDGYLSMINRNEAPLLWPEEFIENETFSPDELKRLSIHLPSESSESSSEEGGKDMELEIVDYEREPSRRIPNNHHHHHDMIHNRSLKSPSGLPDRMNRIRRTKEKAEYFSDDSLEGESEEMNFRDVKSTRTTSVSPYLSTTSSGAYSPKSRDNTQVGSFISSANSPNQYHHHHQRITVNHVSDQQQQHNNHHYQQQYQHSKSQVSRIPKMVTGSPKSRKSGRNSTREPEAVVVMRKPCSFFISLTDEVIGSGGGSSAAVLGKSSSLPKGSKVASIISPASSNKKPAMISPPQVQQDSNLIINNPNPNNSSASNSNSTKQFVSQLPQLRHTKSINTTGPLRTRTNNKNNANNANKRKSTSDLVTVVALNNNQDIREHDEEAVGKFETVPLSKVVVTSSFNRTTFLIPSPCSRAEKASPVMQQPLLKRQRDDDETEDDDFDLLSSTDPDSLLQLQPLTIHNVEDFVSEIMDTAIRHGLKANNTLIDLDNPLTKPLLIHDDDDSNSNSNLLLQEVEPEEAVVKSEEGSSETETLQMTGQDGNEQSFNDKHSSNHSIINGDHDDEEDRVRKSPTVSQQLDAVVTNFLSDNESFLTKVDDKKESDLFHSESSKDLLDQTLIVLQEVKESREIREMEEQSRVQGSSKGEEEIQLECTEEIEKETSSGLNLTVLSLPGHDLMLETEKPLMTSTPITSSSSSALKDISRRGEEKILDDSEVSEEEEDSEELPPEFIPTPPPQTIAITTTNNIQIVEETETETVLSPMAVYLRNLIPSESRSQRFGNNGNMHPNNNPHNHNHHHHHHHHHLNNVSTNVRDGKATLDLLAQRITNSKKSSSPDDHLPVSQFIHDKRNIWALYDRPFDEDLLTVNSTGRGGYASRSQENLMDAMCKERFTKSFSSRGQSSTLPLNCRPPTSQRRSTTFRNMFNKFRRNKPTETVIREIPEYRDDEVQSITSRETGPSEQGKKRGFFSRLFRRSRKN